MMHNVITSKMINTLVVKTWLSLAFKLYVELAVQRLSSHKIVACHRLNERKNDKYPARTIVRFTNRKVVDFCSARREHLNVCIEDLGFNLRFYENLNRENECVLKECIQLQHYGLIDKYFIRNGFLKIIIHNNDRPIKIKHPDDLFFLFNDFYKYGELYDS